jgi:hypothetical protein
VRTTGSQPFTILAANDAWYAQWEIAPADAIGKTLDVIAGPRSSNARVGGAVDLARWCDIGNVVNYKFASAQPSLHRLAVGPVRASDGAIVAMLGVSLVLNDTVDTCSSSSLDASASDASLMLGLRRLALSPKPARDVRAPRACLFVEYLHTAGARRSLRAALVPVEFMRTERDDVHVARALPAGRRRLSGQFAPPLATAALAAYDSSESDDVGERESSPRTRRLSFNGTPDAPVLPRRGLTPSSGD